MCLSWCASLLMIDIVFCFFCNSIAKGDLVLVGANSVGLPGQRWPTLAREFWRSLPPPPPLQRPLPGLSEVVATIPRNRVDGALGGGSFPLLVLPYVDFIEVSDALAHLISHRPDAVLVFAPLFIIGELQVC